MSAAAFHEFSTRLISDDAARALLREAGDDGTFPEKSAALARQWSLDVTAADLTAAAREARRRWMERSL